MKLALAAFLLVSFASTALHAQYPPNPIKHVVVIIQENRTPDNLFQGLCAFGSGCGTGSTQYDIASTYVDSSGNTGPLLPVGLATNFDLDHSHGGPGLNGTVSGWEFEYTNRGVSGSPGVPVPPTCGANVFGCAVPTDSQFMYVYNTAVTNTNNSKGGLLDPYLTLATRYGWANRMFQTNQGPSYPAHQFLFGGTSAPSAADDAGGIFVAENGTFTDVGCAAPATAKVQLIRPVVPMPSTPPYGTETKGDTVPPCFTHESMADLFANANPQISWTYYAASEKNANGGANMLGSIWTAPNSLSSICIPAKDGNGNLQCTGSYWTKGAANGYVDPNPPDVLSDIANCKLAQMNWVTPSGQYSDHPVNSGQGPAWVTAIINAIGNSTACDGGAGYWQDTIVFLTWDDWGAWYDHVAPVILSNTAKYQDQYGYQLGFRVPLVVISAYSPQVGYINNVQHDFGSILKAIEAIFSLGEGKLGFADARSPDDLHNFFNFSQTPTTYTTIPTVLPSTFFTSGAAPLEPPDTD